LYTLSIFRQFLAFVLNINEKRMPSGGQSIALHEADFLRPFSGHPRPQEFFGEWLFSKRGRARVSIMAQGAFRHRSLLVGHRFDQRDPN
jgi:hypothetical protein